MANLLQSGSISHRLGHADATLIHTTYGHGTAERARALADALEANLG